MASWLMRMVSSSGKSIRSRRAICSGLHAVAHRRGCRRPCRRPFQGTTGPRTAALPGPQTSPASLSCTYPRSAAFTASFAGFGRRAARSACPCAVVARYSSPPLRVAALRRSSREIVDAARPSRRAVSRTPQPRARNSASSSRSANDRYRSDGGFADGANILGDMPPASRNQRAPTAGDTPTSIAAASLDRPTAIAAQNRRRFSRLRTARVRGSRRRLSRFATLGPACDRGTTARSARPERRFPALIATPSVKVLRRPLEPKQYVSIRYTERLAAAGIEPSVGSVGDSFDNALAETINGLYKAEVIHRRGPWRSFEAVEFATLEWVDWFNHRRLLEPIGNVPPAEAEARYYAQREVPARAA